MKKWHSILVVLVSVVAIIAITLALLPGLTVGRCLVADNGSVMLIDGDTPIVMSGKNAMFQNLSTGDKLLVVHDGINESYPAQTRAYLVLRLASGTEADIPVKVQMQLAELGWVDAFEYPAEPFDRIQTSYQYANMSLPQLENWEYELITYTENADGWNGCGIRFHPKGQTGGSITLQYCKNWGVCGTGLKEETIALGMNYEAWQGTCDNHEVWDYIYIKGMPGNYVFVNHGAEAWWEAYGDEAMYIVENASLAEGIMSEHQAVSIAAEALQDQGELDLVGPGRCTFDVETGIWTVPLHKDHHEAPDWTFHVFQDRTAELVEAVIYD